MNRSSPDLSIIIPALDEEEFLPSTLEAACFTDCVVERIVVDGGSKDGTVSIASDAGCQVISAGRPHRALQMNLGARIARAKILLFLHADTRLPANAAGRVVESLENDEILGGGFVWIFEPSSAVLKCTGRLAAWRSRKLGLFLGDQGIFVRQKVFESLGGFDEGRTVAEDLDFSRRLKKLGRVVALEGPAISSARRFQRRGPLFQTMTDLWLTSKYFAGSG